MLGQDFHGPGGWEVAAVDTRVTATTSSSLLTGRRFGKDMGQDTGSLLLAHNLNAFQVHLVQCCLDVGCESGSDTKARALRQITCQAKYLMNGARTVGFDHGLTQAST